MKNSFIFSLLFCTMFFSGSAAKAENISKNTARMQAMDKITGRVSVIDVPVNGEVNFSSFSIVVRSCQTRPAEEIPDSFAFVDVADTDLSGRQSNIFRGWMIASSPATNAVEHPIYDVWLLQCLDTKIDKNRLLSAEELEERNNMPAAKQTTKEKSVTEAIDEMQYQKEETKSSDNKDMLIEFETDEETSAEDSEIIEEETEHDTGKSED